MLVAMRTTLCLLVAAVLAGPAVHAQGILSGYMQGAGNTGLAITYSTESYDRYFVADRQTTNPGLGTITTTSVNAYVAAGITSWLDVVVNVPWVDAASNAGLWAPVTAMQDLAAGIRVRPLVVPTADGQLDVMLGGVVGMPMTDYPTDAPVTVGHGARSIDGRIIAQYRTYSGMFIAAQAGYIGRGRVTVDRGFEVDVPDAVDMSLRAGVAATAWYGDVWIQNQVAQSGTNIGPGVAFPSNAQCFVRVGATAVYHVVPQLSLIGAVAGTMQGVNVGASTRFSMGFSYTMPSWSGL